MAEASQSNSTLLRIGPSKVDTATGEVHQGPHVFRLQPQTVQLLMALVDPPGRFVSREELQRRLWPDATVDFEDGLNHAVARLRVAFHDSGHVPRFIETIPRRGYRFIGPVEFLSPASSPAGASCREPAGEAADALARAPTAPAVDAPPGASRETNRHRPWVAPALATIALAGAASLGTFVWRDTSRPPRIEAIAVLPLADLSSDASQQHVADGLTEEVISALARIESLRVISRTSMQRYRDTDTPVPVIARELGVDAVVEGSVQRSGDRVRLTLTLVRARAERLLWSETYDLPLGDVTALRNRVGHAVAEQVGRQVRFEPGPTPVPADAYEAFVVGRRLVRDYTPRSIAKSVGQFERAIALHPSYALAHAALAQSHEMLALRRDERGSQIERALALARRSIELDPNLVEGHLRLATIRFVWEWDWSQCEGEIRRARDLDPTSVNAHFSYMVCLGLLGRFEDAAHEYERWGMLDPLSPADPWLVAVPLQRLGRLTDAIDVVQRAISLDPEDPFNPGYRSRAAYLADLLMAAQRDGEALRVLVEWSRRRGEAPEQASRLETALARGPAEFRDEVRRQDRARFERYLGALEAAASDQPASPVQLAFLHAGLGNLDRAFALLEAAFQEKRPQLAILRTAPGFAPLRGDPRYQALLRKMHLPPDS